MERPFVLARESLSFRNPVSCLIVELFKYMHVNPELKEGELQELLSSYHNRDNINVGGISQGDFDRRCKKVVEAFSKFGLFFKSPVEPWSQMEDGDDRNTGEKLVATLGYLWDIQGDFSCV